MNVAGYVKNAERLSHERIVCLGLAIRLLKVVHGRLDINEYYFLDF